jgi:hypothetical protein
MHTMKGLPFSSVVSGGIPERPKRSAKGAFAVSVLCNSVGDAAPELSFLLGSDSFTRVLGIADPRKHQQKL